MNVLGLSLLAALGSYEGVAALIRHGNRTSSYAAAFQRAKLLGRPLVVVGDPHTGAHTSMVPAYGCGDVCIDLSGCPDCPHAIQADITHGPIATLSDDSAVVFVSCVLEYVSDFEAAWKEIMRVAGSLDNVFVVTVQPWTLTAELYPGAKQVIVPKWIEGSSNPEYHAEPVSISGQLVSAGLVLGLATWGFWPRST